MHLQMVLPTEVNFINESKERIKIAGVNIKPGESKRLSGSKNGGYDIEADIIINPEGPGNNARLGAFKFNNPAIGKPNVRSDEFYWFGMQTIDSFGFSETSTNYHHELLRKPSSRKSTWGALPENYEPKQKGVGTFGRSSSFTVFEDQGFAAIPIFDIEAFPQDDGAKKWDLRIVSIPEF